MITKYHAKYYANMLTGQAIGGNLDTKKSARILWRDYCFCKENGKRTEKMPVDSPPSGIR